MKLDRDVYKRNDRIFDDSANSVVTDRPPFRRINDQSDLHFHCERVLHCTSSSKYPEHPTTGSGTNNSTTSTSGIRPSSTTTATNTLSGRTTWLSGVAFTCSLLRDSLLGDTVSLRYMRFLQLPDASGLVSILSLNSPHPESSARCTSGAQRGPHKVSASERSYRNWYARNATIAPARRPSICAKFAPCPRPKTTNPTGPISRPGISSVKTAVKKT